MYVCRYLHYFTRYHAHHLAQKSATERRKEALNILSIRQESRSETDAIKALINAIEKVCINILTDYRIILFSVSEGNRLWTCVET